MSEKYHLKYTAGQRVRHFCGHEGVVVRHCSVQSMDDYLVLWEKGPHTKWTYPRKCTAAEENLTPMDPDSPEQVLTGTQNSGATE